MLCCIQVLKIVFNINWVHLSKRQVVLKPPLSIEQELLRCLCMISNITCSTPQTVQRTICRNQKPLIYI